MRASVRRGAEVIGRRLEYNALAIALALALAFDAVLANRTLFAAFDASFAAGQTARLGALARELRLERRFCSGRVGVHRPRMVDFSAANALARSSISRWASDAHVVGREQVIPSVNGWRSQSFPEVCRGTAAPNPAAKEACRARLRDVMPRMSSGGMDGERPFRSRRALTNVPQWVGDEVECRVWVWARSFLGRGVWRES